jgi:hypothetical protein
LHCRGFQHERINAHGETILPRLDGEPDLAKVVITRNGKKEGEKGDEKPFV